MSLEAGGLANERPCRACLCFLADGRQPDS